MSQKKPLDLSSLFIQPAWSKPTKQISRRVVNAPGTPEPKVEPKPKDIGLANIIKKKEESR